MKILVLGHKGWLGSMFVEYLKSKDIEVGTFEGDINRFSEFEPDTTAVVNFAASTDIDWCEKNKLTAFGNNILGAIKVAAALRETPVKYVFISSACIFESANAKDIKFEDSKPNPGCFYTETKVMAEKLIQDIYPKALIVRPRLPISEVSHPRNTLDKLANYKKLLNTQESVTVAEDFVVRLLELIEKDATGIYHLVNEGTVSPAEMGELMGHKFEVFTKADLDKQIKEEGKANRVSTVVGSHNGYLPPIKERVVEVIKKWKTTLPAKEKPDA